MPEAYVPAMRDEAVEARTGRGWQRWFEVLDEWGAKTAGHTATARWLQEEHGIAGWWAQSITVEYERARGLRQVGQRTTGDFEVTLQRTIALDVETTVANFVDGRRRRRWLRDDALHTAIRTGMRHRRETDGGRTFDHLVRCPFPWEDGEGRLELSFTDRSGRSVVRVQITKLADQAQRAELKTRWSAQLDRLRDLSS